MRLICVLTKPLLEFLLGVALLTAVMLVAGGAFAQTQSILPEAMTQFTDGNGAPYAGGHVYMYVPFTTTPKVTYQDPNGHTPNQNPITLDANGRGVIWGNGIYRQVLQDSNGVVVWDQLTYASPVNASTLGVLWYGTASGTANLITLSGSATFTAQDGQQVGFFANATNTGSTTINPGGYGSILVEKTTPTGLVVLTGGEIIAGNLYYATYSAGANAFVITSAQLVPVGFVGQNVTGSGNVITIGTTLPSAWNWGVGNTLVFPAVGANTTAVTLTVGGLPFGLYKQAPGGVTPLIAGDITGAGEMISAVWDGGKWQMINSTGRVPSGVVEGFALGSCPAGWHAADGTAGTVNMLGTVARGYDPGATRDPAGAAQAVGSYEADQYQQHTEAAPATGNFISAGALQLGVAASIFSVNTVTAASTGLSNSGNFGPETRAKSTILLFCQKL